MRSKQDICKEFGAILNGKSELKNDTCSVHFRRNFKASVQGVPSQSVLPADVLFESLDQQGNALNLVEIALLQEEVPSFLYSVSSQGLIVSALHNHWLYTDPVIMYLHIQSVEPPLQFARKMAQAFRFLSSPLISE
ncbi:DUF1259 domain-containing protein [Bacillus testis]|uniref:DUF1259 domain-containing protein n=1 Tax=Bacillus testis TaxID=1622072 RepID=UPI00067EAB61|nr:DUF1259 domain-containing protein [Bacillus testis]